MFKFDDKGLELTPLGDIFVASLIKHLHKDGFWTIEDLAMLPEDERRYEILDGQLVMVPSPSFGHQSVVERLRELIRPCLGDTMLSFEGVALDLHPSYRIPDLTIFPTDGFDARSIKLHLRFVLLAVEVVSPGSTTNDRITKPAQYAVAAIDDLVPPVIVEQRAF